MLFCDGCYALVTELQKDMVASKVSWEGETGGGFVAATLRQLTVAHYTWLGSQSNPDFLIPVQFRLNLKC